MRVELFHVDGRTDVRTEMTQLIVIFRNFAKVPKKCSSYTNKIVCELRTPRSPFPHFEINTLLGDDPTLMAVSLYSVFWALLVFPQRHELLPHNRF